MLICRFLIILSIIFLLFVIDVFSVGKFTIKFEGNDFVDIVLKSDFFEEEEKYFEVFKVIF